MNPELMRNTWLELSPVRRWSLPLFMGMLITLVQALNKADTAYGVNWEGLHQLGLWTVVLFSLWGALKASNSVTSEVQGGTWDLQRLAQHRPWDLLWGKLFGSTVFDWLGTSIGLVLFAVGQSQDATPTEILIGILILTSGALLFQSLGLLASLAAASSLRSTRRPTGGSQGQAANLFLLVFLTSTVGPAFSAVLEPHSHAATYPIAWWWTMSAQGFFLLSIVMFLGWSLVGAHRLIRAELQEPVGPGPWIAFLIFLIAYLYPLMLLSPGAQFGTLGAIAWATAAIVCATFVYPLLLGESKDVVRLRSIAAAWRRGDTHALWIQTPLWTYTLVGFIVSVVGFGVCARFQVTPIAGTLWVVGVSTAIYMVRDIGWILAVHLARRPPRQPGMVVLFYLVVLYMLAPALVTALAGETSAILLLLPYMPSQTPVTPTLWLWGLPGCALAWAIAVPALRRVIKA